MKFPAPPLIELVQLAETPLFSAYEWLRDYLDGNLSWADFSDLVNELLEDDIFQLWVTETGSGDRSEVYTLPGQLDERYEEIGHFDRTFDPFGYTLTLGPRADSAPAPPWDADLDFENGLFEIKAESRGAVDEALTRLKHLYPRLQFSLETTGPGGDDGPVRAQGRFKEHSQFPSSEDSPG